MNSEKNKAEVNLSTMGTGVIFFGLWSFIKTALTFLITDIEDTVNYTDNQIIIPTIITTWVTTIFVLLIYCYVGFSARGESKGKDKSLFYLIVIGLMLTFRLFIIVIEAVMIILLHSAAFALIVAIVVDITAFFVLLDIMINSIKLRSIREQIKIEEGAYEL